MIELKDIIFEDFTNYKKPSMFLIFPVCDFKCDKDCGFKICQNRNLIEKPNYKIKVEELLEAYLSNPITKSIVCGGLEPFDTFNELLELISIFREKTNDDIIIYTGYYKEEIEEQLKKITCYSNIIIKFGRIVIDDTSYFNEDLGITLASKNQYTIKY
jgi:organic radical activating enzyme